jgi:hypothetical protein
MRPCLGRRDTRRPDRDLTDHTPTLETQSIRLAAAPGSSMSPKTVDPNEPVVLGAAALAAAISPLTP